MRREPSGEFSLIEEDLEVYETEHLTSCATVVMIDICHSMILYGEDRITPAKKVALALTELITTKYPKDHLDGDPLRRRRRAGAALRDPVHPGGPVPHQHPRRACSSRSASSRRQKQPNKQIFLITDGKPSAITENGRHLQEPLRPRHEDRQPARWRRPTSAAAQKVVITTFMLATDPMLTQFVEKLTQINRGRAYFASPYNLGEFILADYIRNRRRRVR